MISSSFGGKSGFNRKAAVAAGSGSHQRSWPKYLRETAEPGRHLIQNCAEGKQIGTRIKLFSLGLLR